MSPIPHTSTLRLPFLFGMVFLALSVLAQGHC